MEISMMSYGKETLIENPTWWKRRSALERGLTVMAASGALVCITLAISITVVVTSSRSCNIATPIGTSEPQDIFPVAFAQDPSVVDGPTPPTPTGGTICVTPDCIHTASIILNNMDPKVDPCNDFYKFACGGFINSTKIRDSNTVIDHFSSTTGKILEQLRTTVEDKIDPDEPRPLKLVKELYSICMNKTIIEELGVRPILKILKDIGGYPLLEGDSWNEKDFDWMELVYKLRDIGFSYNYLLDSKITTDLKNSTRKMFILDQASFGISCENLLLGLDNKIVKAYSNYMVDVAIILGAEPERAKAELMESLLFEMDLANISVCGEQRRNVSTFYNPMTIAELSKNYSTIPWKDYFDRILKPFIEIDEKEVINVKTPSFFANFHDLISKTPKRVLANYMMQRVVVASINYLTDKIRVKQLEFSKAIVGRTARDPRWLECMNMVSGRLSLSTGALYIKKYFNKNAKRNALDIVREIRQQFRKTLESVDWMDNSTRRNAILKATQMKAHIAYPDELLNNTKLEEFYENLKFTEGDYLGSMLNLALFERNYSFSTFRKPINKSDWVTHGQPTIANAFYSFSENSIQLPAGILQGMFFNSNRPKYMNYGAIGYIIGHEITHGFDNRGRKFDRVGNLANWWASATREKYRQKTECIIHQYGNYTVKEVGLNLNGINTLGENIADNGGIRQAYLAYKEWSKKRLEPRLPGLRWKPIQMFWISAAHTWCSVYRPETLKHRIATGLHSPSEFRVLGPFSNMPEFSQDFQCPIGSRMNPSTKCRIW